MNTLNVKKYPKGPLQENTYFISDVKTDLCAIIDPGYFGEDIVWEIGEDNQLAYIILTHVHFDHFYSARKYLEKYPNAQFVVPKKDIPLMKKDWNTDVICDGYSDVYCPDANTFVDENDSITLGDTNLTFIETPGHTKGSMCIFADDKLFSGDTLFRFSVGNTSFETGNWDELVDSIQNKLYTLDDNIIVFPGHGPITTIGEEKRGNPFV